MASTILFATSDSEAAKNPRFLLTARRSSAVNPSGLFHMAISACIEISVGIQWLLQPDKYLSQAHRYLRGRSWFTSARQLIIALSSTRTRDAPRAILPRPVLPESSLTGGGVSTNSVGLSSITSVQSSIASPFRCDAT